jgi:hypothetical protein|tara:strand:+ start:173 stop:1027 length:855 start_codon:yes stop_codon:yes gene_type:complete
MNALVNINTIPALPESLNFTPVREQQMRGGREVTGKWWTINPLTDEVIGDGKRNHNPQNFALMWDKLREGLYQSGLQLSDATTTFRTFNKDAGLRAEIILPNHNFVAALGEASCLKIRVVDSHDQTQRRQVGAMIMRLACLNGMVSMAENTSLSQLHTQSAEPERIGKVAATWPELLLGDASKMQAMREVKVSRHRAIDFYSDHVASHKTRIGMTLNKSMLNRIMGIHDSYSALNDSAYRVYNVLTHLSTHVESRSCVNKKQLVMEDKIGSIIKGDAFKQLAFA